MKHPHSIRVLATLMIVGLLATPVATQNTAQERAASLRQQLVEVQEKQTEYENRLHQLEEDLKPESIEKALAGIGSTRPEELRQQRRRLLEIEKKSVQTRLVELATSRRRLETGIVQADNAAYHGSARPNASGGDKEAATKTADTAQPGQAASPTVRRRTRRSNKNKSRRTRRNS